MRFSDLVELEALLRLLARQARSRPGAQRDKQGAADISSLVRGPLK